MNSVYVIGGANIDIIGRSNEVLIQKDSNIGQVTQNFGGVGRNIAENIARYEVNVHFISAVGNDSQGKQLLDYCKSSGMDVEDCLIVENESTSSYLAILDQEGDMQIGINDMGILKHLTIEALKDVFLKLEASDLLVIDTNLEPSLIEWMMQAAPCKIFVDPISCNKVHKLENKLNYIHTFKPNIYEAQTLTGLQDPIEIAKQLQHLGIQESYISLGSEGVIALCGDHLMQVKAKDIEVKSANGAGDAFMAALCVADLYKMSFTEKVYFATTASVLTLECNQSVCPHLSIDLIKERMETIKFVTKELSNELKN